jgi:antitoxin (DNA-binding transcriptional repressor) of toxin-antitoxin stability system
MDITTTELEARCLKLIDDLVRSQEPSIITKRGKPIATLLPIEHPILDSGFGYMRGTVTFLGEIVEPQADGCSAKIGNEPRQTDLLHRGETR